MKENINVLDEINKGACMGIDAISYIIDKVKDKKFKKLLERQSSEYKKISEDINEISDNNSDYLQKARKYGHFTGYKN